MAYETSRVRLSRSLFENILATFLHVHKEYYEVSPYYGPRIPDTSFEKGLLAEVLRKIFLEGGDPAKYEIITDEVGISDVVDLLSRELGFACAQASQRINAHNQRLADDASWLKSKRDKVVLQDFSQDYLNAKQCLGNSYFPEATLYSVLENQTGAGFSRQGTKRRGNEDRIWLGVQELPDVDLARDLILERTVELGRHLQEQRCGSTFTLASVQGKKKLVTAQAGDGGVWKLTLKKDKWHFQNCVPTHNGDDDTVAGSILVAPDVQDSHMGYFQKKRPQRWTEDLAIGRAFGDCSYVSVGLRFYPSITEYDLDPTADVEIVVTVCDGLTDVLSESDIIAIVDAWYKTTPGDYEKLSKLLCAYAQAKGVADNTSAICFDVRTNGATAVMLDGHGGDICAQMAIEKLDAEGFFKEPAKDFVDVYLPVEYIPTKIADLFIAGSSCKAVQQLNGKRKTDNLTRWVKQHEAEKAINASSAVFGVTSEAALFSSQPRPGSAASAARGDMDEASKLLPDDESEGASSSFCGC
jgi:serine/threonine protein phosphatase PrpC